MGEIIIAFITGVISPVTILLVKNWLDKRKKPDMVTETLKVSEIVYSKIDDIREEMGANRVWITQFHNGGNFYPTGKSMAKFSIMYEVVSENTHSIQANFKNMAVNLFSRSINQLYHHDYIAIPDYKDVTVATFGLKDIAESANCKSGYLFAIKNIDGKFIGTLGIDYTEDLKTLTNDQITHMLIHASSIGGVLMTHLSQ
jgi:hypothetical protein